MEKWNDQDINKISQILHSITKMDTIFIDQDGNNLFQLINHSIPAVLNPPNNEYTHINEVLSNKPSNDYYHYINMYGLEYLAVGIWRGLSFYGRAVGPFISSMSFKNVFYDHE